MKKSVIKRRKRVVPATNEQESGHSRLNSFPVSPSATPQHIMPLEPNQRPRGSSNMDTYSPLDLRPNQQHLDSPELRNKQRVSSSMDSNSPLNLDLRQRNRQTEHHHQYEPPPIEVDFTGYQIDQRKDHHNQSPHNHSNHQLPPLSSIQDPSQNPSEAESHSRLSPFPSTSRKRSHSNTEHSSPSPSTTEINRPARLSSISSILNHPHQSSNVEEIPLDPNLSALPPQLQQHRHSTPSPLVYQLMPPRQSTSSDPGTWELNEKKARLKREAEQMRESLRAKELELEELEREH